MKDFFFVGLDIRRYKCWCAFLDKHRVKIASFPFENSHQGYQKLLQDIREKEEELSLTPLVSAEGHSGHLSPLDQYLLQEGITFIPLQPIAVSRHRDLFGQPTKTDEYDAFIIAHLLSL